MNLRESSSRTPTDHHPVQSLHPDDSMAGLALWVGTVHEEVPPGTFPSQHGQHRAASLPDIEGKAAALVTVVLCVCVCVCVCVNHYDHCNLH